MCASYTPSLSVSTRTMVAPGYFASAAALTFAAVSPVSSVSSERCGLLGSPGFGFVGGAGAAVAAATVVGVAAVLAVVAALAVSEPARMPPAPRPPASKPAVPAYVRIFEFMEALLRREPVLGCCDQPRGRTCDGRAANL